MALRQLYDQLSKGCTPVSGNPASNHCIFGRRALIPEWLRALTPATASQPAQFRAARHEKRRFAVLLLEQRAARLQESRRTEAP